MSKSVSKTSGNPELPVKADKTFSVRSLRNLNDVAKLQARLLRSYLRDELPNEKFRSAMTGTRILAKTLEALDPPASDNPFGVSLFSGVLMGSGNPGDYEEFLENKREAEEAAEKPLRAILTAKE